jgi:hypothetical protein
MYYITLSMCVGFNDNVFSTLTTSVAGGEGGVFFLPPPATDVTLATF